MVIRIRVLPISFTAVYIIIITLTKNVVFCYRSRLRQFHLHCNIPACRIIDIFVRYVIVYYIIILYIEYSRCEIRFVGAIRVPKIHIKTAVDEPGLSTSRDI